jgi:hypothetical protein
MNVYTGTQRLDMPGLTGLEPEPRALAGQAPAEPGPA